MIEELNELAQRLGWDFRDRSLLFQSLVHRSYLNENPGTRLKSNERLEFLGDAVLDALAAEFLFERCPGMGEGELTLWRSALVRTESLADFAAQLDLGRYLIIGRGEESDGGRSRTTILADAFEAVLGAVYLDGGIKAARFFFTPFMVAAMDRFAGQSPIDFKSALQIEVQGRSGITPQYRTAGAWGPDHARTFQVEVWAGDRLLGRGEGLSKQAAQQEAARAALEQLEAEQQVDAGARPDEQAVRVPAVAAKEPERRRAAASAAEEAPKQPRRRRAAASTPQESKKPRSRRNAADVSGASSEKPRKRRSAASPAEELPKKPRKRRSAASPAEELPKKPRKKRTAASAAEEPPKKPRARRAAASAAEESPQQAPKRRRAARKRPPRAREQEEVL